MLKTIGYVMDSLIQIKEITPVVTSDNQPGYFVKGVLQTQLNLGVQPAYIQVATEIDLNKNNVGDVVDLETPQANPLFMCTLEDKDPWEFLGSDGVTAMLWYGEQSDIESMCQTVYEKLKEGYQKITREEDQKYQPFNSSPLFVWNFEDGNSLLLLHIEEEDKEISVEELPANKLIHFVFGAKTDDILGWEFLMPVIGKALKKIKVGQEDFDPEEFEHLEDYAEYIQYENKPITKKETQKILELAHHIYCEMLQWHEMDENEDVDNVNILAQKLQVWKSSKQIEVPKNADSQKLIYTQGTSNKEYNVSLMNENSNWQVVVSYGQIGKKMTTETKIETANLSEAQKVYIDVLSEKMAKGYKKTSNPTKKCKP